VPWQTLPDAGAADVALFRRAKRSRFLVDESLGPGAKESFERHRLSAVDVWQIGLNGHDDCAVFAYSWRHRRILLTHDEDFWDDRRFPEHRKSGSRDPSWRERRPDRPDQRVLVDEADDGSRT